MSGLKQTIERILSKAMTGYRQQQLREMVGNVVHEPEASDVNIPSNEEEPATKFDDLPIEMQEAVFRRISNPKDMLNCRQVCTLWKNEVDFVLQTDPTQSLRTNIGDVEQLRNFIDHTSRASENPFPSRKLRYGHFNSEPREEADLYRLYETFVYVGSTFGPFVRSLQYYVTVENYNSARHLMDVPAYFWNLEQLCIMVKGYCDSVVQSHIIQSFGLPEPKEEDDRSFRILVLEMRPGDLGPMAAMERAFSEALQIRNPYTSLTAVMARQLRNLKSLQIFSIPIPLIVDGFLERYGDQLEALEVECSSICNGRYFATHQLPKLIVLKIFIASKDLISGKPLLSAKNLPCLESLTVDFDFSQTSLISLGRLGHFLEGLPRTIKVLHLSCELEWVIISDEDQVKIGSLKRFPNLTVLTLSATFLRNSVLLNRFLSRIDNLKVLKLELLTRGDIRKNLEHDDDYICDYLLPRVFRRQPSLVEILLVRNDFTRRLLINEYSCGAIRRYFVQDRSDINKNCKVEFVDF